MEPNMNRMAARDVKRSATVMMATEIVECVVYQGHIRLTIYSKVTAKESTLDTAS